MIREAMVFHYLDDLDSKIAAVRVALDAPSGDDEWSAYSSALGRKFLKLDEFLKPAASAAAPESQQPTEPKPQTQTPAAAAAAAAAADPAAPAGNPKPEAPSLLRKLFS
jgi:hypothetical protein